MGNNSKFQSVPRVRNKKSLFDLSRETKLTGKFGPMYPVFLEEVLPTDKFRGQVEIMARLQPMIYPIYHRVEVFVHFFFVPWRIIWDDYGKWITGGEDGLQEPVHPYMVLDEELEHGSLPDYLGLPTVEQGAGGTVVGKVKTSVLPFRAYQAIYQEYFRDQDLQTGINQNVTKDSGKVTDLEKADLLTLRRRTWEKDYFTSSRPQAQKGPEIKVPTSGINYKPASEVFTPGGTPVANEDLSTDATGKTISKPSLGQVRIENLDNVDNAIDILVEDLRRSSAIQRFQEKLMRGGNRLREYFRNVWGSNAGDPRLDYPEYLGGTRTPISVSEVLQTSESAAGTPQGTFSGHGIAVGGAGNWKGYFPEHGYVMGIMSIRPRSAYHQGIPRLFQRFDRFDVAIPDFAQLGEMKVWKKEVFHDHLVPYDPELQPGEDEVLFGYQEQYAPYKHAENTMHGDFKGNLKNFTLNRIFSAEPSLNNDFVRISDGEDLDRIFAVQDGSDYVWINTYHNVRAIRPLPYNNIPTLK